MCCFIVLFLVYTLWTIAFSINVPPLKILEFSLILPYHHVANICSAVSKILGFIIRTLRYLNNIDAGKILYISYVRKMEYVNVLWYSPYRNQEFFLLRVQCQFFRFLVINSDRVYSDCHIGYDSLLQIFNLHTLYLRTDAHSISGDAIAGSHCIR